MTASIEKGWLSIARRVVSPNYDVRPLEVEIDLLVLHGISLPPGQYGGPEIEAFFCNCLVPDEHPYFAGIAAVQVSAHFLVRRDGELVQFVALGDRAWHAGESCFEGRERCNDFSIGVELEGCDDESYEAAQYERLVELSVVLMSAYPGIVPEHIVGHCDIAPGRKTDPGQAFDWNYFRRLLAGAKR